MPGYWARMSVYPYNNKAELDRREPKVKTMTLALAHTGGMRGHARHTGECPDPGSLLGVSCRANITSHQHHHHHTSTGDKAGHLSYSAQHTVRILYPSKYRMFRVKMVNFSFLCMKSAWHLTRCWCSPHYAALQAVLLQPTIKTYQTEWKYVPQRFYQ